MKPGQAMQDTVLRRLGVRRKTRLETSIVHVNGETVPLSDVVGQG